MGDVLEDPASEVAMQAVERQELHNALEAALVSLPEDQRAAIVGEYYHGQAVNQKARDAGLRALRNPKISRRLRQFL